NECYALDAGTGRQIWRFQFARQRNAVGNQGGVNRGVAAAGDKVFLVTDNAHIIALNRFTGATVWDTEMADWKQNYSAPTSPNSSASNRPSGSSRRTTSRRAK